MVKKRILIVDDDNSILQSFRYILEGEGYEVEVAAVGEEAIKKSEKQYFDMALLDIMLPDMKGTELLIKLHGKVPKMVSIMITGHADLENAVTSLNMGANAYIMKPVDAETLLGIVKEKFREQQADQEMSEEKVGKWVETRIRKLESDSGSEES